MGHSELAVDAGGVSAEDRCRALDKGFSGWNLITTMADEESDTKKKSQKAE